MGLSKFQAKAADSGSGGSPFAQPDEAAQFFQMRLALIGRIGFLFILGYYLLSNISSALSGGPAFTDVGSWVLLANMVCCAATWALCRQGKLPHVLLTVIDVWILLFFCLLVAYDAWADRDDPFSHSAALMSATWAVMARAVFVPSSAWRTAWISLTGFLPLFVVAHVIGSDPGTVWPEGLDRPSLATYVIRGVIGAGLATVVSSVIYGLQRQVRKAQQLGQYQLEEMIGQGGMGEVYKASHAMLRRPTAIKLLRPELAGERSLERFEREVQLTSQLTHPNTIAIYDYGRTPAGIFYYAMEYLEGVNLDQLVRLDGAQPPGRVIHILKQVCASLKEAHSVGMIHRDIKPGNIILCERGGFLDVAKVVDFGLVKRVDNKKEVTLQTADMVSGTPLYMSPESIRDPDCVDARTDIYALGAVGFFLLTGRPLFDSESVVEICSDQLSKDPERPSVRLGRPLSEDLENLVLQCVEKDPALRPATASDLIDALTACADAGSWTDADALTWWKTRGQAASGVASGSPSTLDTLSGTRLAATITSVETGN